MPCQLVLMAFFNAIIIGVSFRKTLALSLLIILFIPNSAQAFMGFGKKKDTYQEELEKYQKTYKEIEEKRQPEQSASSPTNTELPVINLNQELTKTGQVVDHGYKQSETLTIEKHIQKDQEQKAGSKSEKVDKKTSKSKSRDKSPKQSDVDKKRQELKEDEKQALDFIFQSTDTEDEISKENFFSRTEKEQLLELWRATLARNRTIQFIIKSLSANPDEYEKNNAIMQALSKALFVPFYAVAAVSDNSLVSGGTSVGARVIGDIVETQNEAKDRSREITRTDLIVLFMLVDEVANRLRTSYYAYKEARIEKQLIQFELPPARLDQAEAFESKHKNDSAIFFTRMVVRDLERRARVNKLSYLNSRRNLIELAGEEAVNSVDLLIDLEIEDQMQDVLGV